jgi:peptidoglycan/xylan/chitin deacetylase (PgdA/CDA1 family)
MRASLMTRAGSVAAAAVIATTGAIATAGAAGASTHHAWRHHALRLPTHLSALKVRAAAHHKHVFVIGGRLTTFRFPLGDRVIFLDRIAGSSLVRVSRDRTNRVGVAAFPRRPPWRHSW